MGKASKSVVLWPWSSSKRPRVAFQDKIWSISLHFGLVLVCVRTDQPMADIYMTNIYVPYKPTKILPSASSSRSWLTSKHWHSGLSCIYLDVFIL